MLLNSETLDAIRRGTVSLVFRRWRRPTVRSGGTLMTGAGQLEIGDVRVVDVDSITADDAARAGYTARETLLHELAQREDGEVYRVELGELRPDPRIALRDTPLDDGEVARVQARLDRLDAASPDGPWTLKTLRAICEHPGLRAADLCRHVGQERDRFKTNVRKLKNLGLTESLEVGYRLSPRGRSLLVKSLAL